MIIITKTTFQADINSDPVEMDSTTIRYIQFMLTTTWDDGIAPKVRAIKFFRWVYELKNKKTLDIRTAKYIVDFIDENPHFTLPE